MQYGQPEKQRFLREAAMHQKLLRPYGGKKPTI